MSTKEPTVTASPVGVSVAMTPEQPAAATTVADVSAIPQPAQQEDRSGLGVGLMVLLVFTVTILSALADTAMNGSITYLTGAVFVVISVIAAATVGYRDLSTAIITPPLAYFTAIVIAGQPDLLNGNRDNLLIREGAMVIAGLAYSAPWIFAGTGAAALIVIVRRWILHR